MTCGVIESIDRKQAAVDHAVARAGNAQKLNNQSYEVNDAHFSLGPEIHKDLLATGDLGL